MAYKCNVTGNAGISQTGCILLIALMVDWLINYRLMDFLNYLVTAEVATDALQMRLWVSFVVRCVLEAH